MSEHNCMPTMTRFMQQDEQYVHVVKPQVVSSGGMGPCIGVGIYCPSLNEGFLCHYAGPSKGLPKMCLEARLMFSGDDVRIVVAGGAIDDGDNELVRSILGDDAGDVSDITLVHRSYVTDILRSFFGRKVNPQYSQPNTTSQVIIDTKRRRILRAEIPDAAFEQGQ